MFWVLFIGINIFSIAIADIFVASTYKRNDNSYECKLGSKTPYRCVANYDDSSLKYPGCIPKKIWLILRHGTRYPGKKYIFRMIEELPQLQHIILENYKNGITSLSINDAISFKEWKPSFIPSDMMKLASEGENEMIDLGERYQARFSLLMPDVYNNQTYRFKYTSTQRTEESAKHFATGLFGWHNSQNVWYPEAIYQDPVIRFYKACPRWRQEIGKNPDAILEKTKFLNSEIVTNMLNNITKHIAYKINYDTAHLMHTMCAFETAWNQSMVSPWCKIFSLNDFKIFEYAEDLKFYWIDGYGYRLTYEQACPALKDMFDFFASKEKSTAKIYFAHSGTILKLLALLGVAKDAYPLTHNTFVQNEKSKRAWRSSIIDAFASNMAFVLYDCASHGPSILFMLQERPISLPNCPNNAPCPMSIMKTTYPDRDEECRFDDMCRIQNK